MTTQDIRWIQRNTHFLLDIELALGGVFYDKSTEGFSASESLQMSFTGSWYFCTLRACL